MLETRRLLAHAVLDTGFAGPASSFTGYLSSGMLGVGTIRGIAAQPGNKTLIHTDGNIRRLTSDGELDMSFGAAGVVRTPTFNGFYRPLNVVTLPDGRFYVLIEFSSELGRFLPNGQVDSTFGNNGWTVIPGSHVSGIDEVPMVVAPDGTILIGRSGSVLRIDSAGAFLGYSLLPSGQSLGAQSIAPLSDGSFVVSFNDIVTYIPGGGVFTQPSIARFTPSGVLDSSFGTNQRITFPEGYRQETGNLTLRARSDGRFYFFTSWQDVTVVECFNPDGTPYTSFANNGTFQTDLVDFIEVSIDAVVEPDDSLIFESFLWYRQTDPRNTADTALMRITANGQADPLFGEDNGMAILNAGNVDRAVSFARHADGSIVALAYDRVDQPENPAVGWMARYFNTTGASVQADGYSQLIVLATPQPDDIRLANGVGGVMITLNGVSYGPFSDIETVSVRGGNGDDTLTIPAGFASNATFVGGGQNTGDAFNISGTGTVFMVGGTLTVNNSRMFQYAAVETLAYTGSALVDRLTINSLGAGVFTDVKLGEGDDRVVITPSTVSTGKSGFSDLSLDMGMGANDQITARMTIAGTMILREGRLTVPRVGRFQTFNTESLILNGSAETDTFEIEPTPNLATTVRGNGFTAGTAGDVLHVVPSAVVGATRVDTSATAGYVTFISPFGTITWDNVQSVAIEPDATGPTVSSWTLESDIQLLLIVRFSQPIASTIDSTKFGLIELGSATTIPLTPGQFTIGADGSSVEVALDISMRFARYRLTLAAGAVTNLAGLPSAFSSAVEFNLTTGDINGSGEVDFNDLLTLVQHYGQSPATRAEGDIDYDGAVGFGDILLLSQNYGASIASLMTPASKTPARSKKRQDSMI